MIKYYKLFDLINRREMKKTDLLKIMSSPTLAKLGKGEIVKTDVIDKICLFLECQPGDIMECMSYENMEDGYKKETISLENGEKYISYYQKEEDYSPEYRLSSERIKNQNEKLHD